MPVYLKPIGSNDWLECRGVCDCAKQMSQQIPIYKEKEWLIQNVIEIIFLESNIFEKECGINIRECTNTHPFWEWFEENRWPNWLHGLFIETVNCDQKLAKKFEHEADKVKMHYSRIMLEIKCSGFRKFYSNS